MITKRRLVLGVVLLIAITGVLVVSGSIPGPSVQTASNDDRPDRYTERDSVSLGGAGGDAGDFDRATATPAPAATPAARDDTGSDRPSEDFADQERSTSDGSNQAGPTVRERARIKTGRITLQVEDFETARSSLERRVRSHGGYVSGTSSRLHREENTTWTTGQVTLRVPAQNFSRLRSQVRGSGVLLNEDVSTRDVTDKLVDLNARIENLQHQRDRLRSLAEQANETEDLLAIQQQLSDVQGTIERLKAQRTSLRRQVSYSTLTVELREPEPESPRIDPPNFHERPLLSAFLDSVHGVIVLIQSAVVATAYALPYLVVGTVIGVPLLLARRRWGG